MTVEVALSVMAGARAGHLLVCDDGGLCSGLVTQAQLAAVRDSFAYTDRVQLRDILGQGGPFTSPVTPKAEAEHALHRRRAAARPGLDLQGGNAGVLALAR
jgi:CBS domain-containing protein